MATDPGAYKAFRSRLDDVLRHKDPAALREFLVAEGQWERDATTDTEAAMWMMIATSPALRSMHDEAERWLLAHGHEAEVSAIFGGRRKPTNAAPRGASPATRPRHQDSSPSARAKREPRGNKPGPRRGYTP